jgi:hypothetical protein
MAAQTLQRWCPFLLQYPGLSLRSNPSMKPGRVKRNSGFDWFTLLFEFPRFSLRFSVVVSFNGATSLILGYEFLHSGLPRVSRHLNQFPNLPFPTRV